MFSHVASGEIGTQTMKILTTRAHAFNNYAICPPFMHT